MAFLLISFIAGVLTVMAPCVFTLIPIILGRSLVKNNYKKAFIIIASLLVSIFVFTLALRVSTLFITIPQSFWNILSGTIIILIALSMIFPNIWTKISAKLGIQSQTDKIFHQASQKNGILGDILVGVSLGPVFSSCSPTYGLIIAVILPLDFTIGVINLIVYLLGLGTILTLILFLGQKFIKRARWLVDPNGRFKTIVGIIFLVIGFMIIFGLDKQLEILLLDNGLFDPTNIENMLMNFFNLE